MSVLVCPAEHIFYFKNFLEILKNTPVWIPAMEVIGMHPRPDIRFWILVIDTVVIRTPIQTRMPGRFGSVPYFFKKFIEGQYLFSPVIRCDDVHITPSDRREELFLVAIHQVQQVLASDRMKHHASRANPIPVFP